ncbi:MAG TPA: zf-HC2 domain-containing protein [Bryobacteraceae bacterium]|nr:zf-HC2 domain-containing protein [Bryobacteraceae bacterium]
MNCVEWEERIALYAGGDLARAEAQPVERHVAKCAGCQVLLSGLRESLALVREAHGEPIEAAHFAAVRARVLAGLERAPARRWRYAWAGALAAAVLLVGLWPRPELHMAVPIPKAPAAPAIARTVPPPHPRALAKPRPPEPVQQASAPMVVKLLTDDPDVVIYWITGTKGE